MATALLDSFGRPAEWRGFSGRGLYESPQDDGTRLDRPMLDTDIATLLPRVKHRALVSDSRWIASTFPLVQGAVQQKAHYVCQAGFTPVFTGANKEWGRLAREALVQAHRVIDVRGGLFHWNKCWQIGCTLLDIDGGFFVVRGETDTGYPQLQFLEAHRVGSRFGSHEDTVQAGPYKGLRILNGIIYNARGREVAYRVLGNAPEQDRDISALDMHHVAAPRWFSDGRPFPTIAYSILDWYDAREARRFQQLKQKVNSAITMVETTADGKAPIPSVYNSIAPSVTPGTSATTSPSQPMLQYLAGGLIRYVKSGAGDIKSHADNTPGTGWLQFDERVVAGAFYGMDWRSEMLDLSKLSGAPTRGFQDQINTTIYARWLDLTPHVHADDMFILRKLIARGDLPDNDEWWSWAYTPPAEFTVDGGRSNKADLENVRAGTDTTPSIVARFGRTAEEVLREQAEYLRLKHEIEAEHGLAPGTLGTTEPAPAGARYTDNPPNARG